MTDGFDLQGKLRIDLTELDEIPERTETAVSAADGQTIEVTTVVNDAQATKSFADTERKIATLDSTIATPKIRVDASQGHEALNQFKTEFRASIAEMDADLLALRIRTGALPQDATLETMREYDTPGAGTDRAAAAASAATRSKYLAMGAAIGVPLALMAAKGIAQATVPMAQEKAKVESAVTRRFGVSQGSDFIIASEKLAEATGFLSTDFQRAAMEGKTLAAFSDDAARATALQSAALKTLLPLAADVAATSPDKALQTVAGAFRAMKSAITGSAAASESLGIDLSDGYMATRAFGGALRSTWSALSDTEKAQLRYQEMLSQTKDIMGEAGDENSLEFQTRKLNDQLGELAIAVGEQLLEPLKSFVKLIRDLVDAIPDWMPKAVALAVKGQEGGGWPVRPITKFMKAVVDLPGPRLVQPKAERQGTPFENARAGAVADPSIRPGYYPLREDAVMPPIKISLNVRKEPGTTVNLDGASYAPSNT